MGAVAWGRWPTPRFPSPLIEPDVRRYRIRLSDWLHRFPVGVVVERRKAISPWAEFLWHPVAVLAGLPDAAAWTPLANDADAVTYYAGPAEIALHGSEA